ncbi:hypothetical protein RND71_023598 [Anisodus tanguticus]|uniref:Uncharacterized protein n=1 Tax=Anisodus tanguticus TaxID=243964 RepID=A0AAE1RU74_9SOLA|nr:hypothetical protein RND71_023598 [Anisodus tanguticus]
MYLNTGALALNSYGQVHTTFSLVHGASDTKVPKDDEILGWVLMQQNNHIEAGDAYRRALVIAPKNNKDVQFGYLHDKVGEEKGTLELNQHWQMNLEISNFIAAIQTVPPVQKSLKPDIFHGNLLNIDAPPLYSSKFVKEPVTTLFPEGLKRTRFENAADPVRRIAGEYQGALREAENKMRKMSIPPEIKEDRWGVMLPHSKDVKQAIIAAAPAQVMKH